jgi:Predicted Zn peptidase
MKAIAVSIEPEILTWLVQQANVKKMSEDTLKKIKNWQCGDKQPTFNQILDISNETKLPLGYFFLKTPPVEDYSFMEYRTINSRSFDNPSRDLIDTIDEMEYVQDWMRDYLIQSNSMPLDFVGAASHIVSSVDIANRIRDYLNLDVEWYRKNKGAEDSFRSIQKFAQNSGILIMKSGIVKGNTHRTLDIKEFRAFTLIDKYAPLIFINTNDSKNGQLFSILHEIAHIWFGENNLFNNQKDVDNNLKPIEVKCNSIASEILVPQSIFVDKWEKSKDEESELLINDLSKYFKCGQTVIARKALDNGYIKKELYEQIMNTAISYYLESVKNNAGGGDYYRTAASRIDNRFLLSLATSVQEGKTLYSDAFRLTNTNHKTFLKLVENVGGRNKHV